MAPRLPRPRAGWLDDDDALVLLRQLGIAFIGLSLVLGVDGAEEIVLLCRLVGGLCALVIVGVVLVGRAHAEAAGRWALLALATSAVGLTVLLRMLQIGSQNALGELAWPVVGGLAGGIAIAARVGSAAGARAAQRSGDAYALHLQRRRDDQRHGDDAAASMAWLARPMLLVALVGLGGFAVFSGLLELFDDSPGLVVGLIGSACVLIAPLTAAAVLMAMPLFGKDAGRADGAGLLRRVWTRSSGLQPVADLIGSAIASLITIASRPPSGPSSTRPTRRAGRSTGDPSG